MFQLNAARKEIEVKPHRVKTGGRARSELTWPRVTTLVRLATERGVKIGVLKELVSEFRERQTKTESFKLARFSMEYRFYFCSTKLKWVHLCKPNIRLMQIRLVVRILLYVFVWRQ